MVRKTTLLLALLVFSSLLHSQEIRYVNDVLVIQLRTGPSFNHRNFKGLTSGARLVVLETTDDGAWAHVKAGEEQGWVPTQYLTEEPAARDQLKAANRQLEKLKQQNASLQQQLAEVSQQLQQAQSELDSLSSQKSNLDAELQEIKAVSSNAIQLNSDNARLLQENEALKNQVDVLSTDNQRLSDARKSDEFMNGAFAVLIGVFITLLVPRLWPKKRTEWA